MDPRIRIRTKMSWIRNTADSLCVSVEPAGVVCPRVAAARVAQLPQLLHDRPAGPPLRSAGGPRLQELSANLRDCNAPQSICERYVCVISEFFDHLKVLFGKL